MIVTDKHVLLCMPKTGTSFIKEVLKRIEINRKPGPAILYRGLIYLNLLKSPLTEVFTISEKGRELGRTPNRHGGVNDIPKEFSDRELAMTIRSPLTLIVSRFYYQGWRRFNDDIIDKAQEDFPTFPDLTFEEYLEFNFMVPYWRNPELDPKLVHIGPQSIRLIKMLSISPDKLMANLTDEMIDSEEVLLDLPDVKLIPQENLRENLRAFLKENGFKDSELGIIENFGERNVSNKKRENPVTPSAENKIRFYERLFFAYAKKNGVEY